MIFIRALFIYVVLAPAMLMVIGGTRLLTSSDEDR